MQGKLYRRTKGGLKWKKKKCCEHGKRKTYCKVKGCGVNALCEHGKRKAYYKVRGCGGGANCELGKRKVLSCIYIMIHHARVKENLCSRWLILNCWLIRTLSTHLVLTFRIHYEAHNEFWNEVHNEVVNVVKEETFNSSRILYTIYRRICSYTDLCLSSTVHIQTCILSLALQVVGKYLRITSGANSARKPTMPSGYSLIRCVTNNIFFRSAWPMASCQKRSKWWRSVNCNVS